MSSIVSLCRRHRRLLLAAGYLLVLAFAVMYLRVTISVPPEGDDKLTLNKWMFAFDRTPFLEYLWQDLGERMRYFTLQEVRFFPFHYPSAFSLLFFGSLTSYRLYIIGVTAAAGFLTSRVVARLSGSNALALGGFALALALAPIFNEGMYSYYAVPQKALFWAMAGWLCLLRWEDTGHRRWAVAAGVLAFLSCGTYEIGYMYTVIGAVLWMVRRRSIPKGLLGCAPTLAGTAVALAFHLGCSGGSGNTGNALALNLPEIARVTVQQMAASLPFLNPLLLGEDPGTITGGDKLWPLLLGIVVGLVLCFGAVRRRWTATALGGMALLGLALWAGPALLLACSERYQQPEAITWKWGYIPAAASAVGLALLLAAAVVALGRLLLRLPRWPSAVLRLGLASVIAVGLCANGAYTRACLRSHHAQNLDNYYFFVDTIQAGLADAVTEQDLILCNENVWGSDATAESMFFSRFTGRELHAQVMGTELAQAPAGSVYGYQTYRNYGGYDLAWCGRAQDVDATLLDTLTVYVQGALVPDNAVIKYTVRLPDGSEEARSICLLDCDRTPRNAKGDYLATVEDSSIVNAKVMIWDG